MTKFNAPDMSYSFEAPDKVYITDSCDQQTEDYAGYKDPWPGDRVEYTRSDLLKKYFKEISDAADKLHSLLNRSRDFYPKTSDAVLCIFKQLNTIDEILKKVNDDE